MQQIPAHLLTKEQREILTKLQREQAEQQKLLQNKQKKELAKFETATPEQKQEMIQRLQKEMQRWLLAALPEASESGSGGEAFNMPPSTIQTAMAHNLIMSQLSPLFTQFLAWQRLMQISIDINQRAGDAKGRKGTRTRAKKRSRSSSPLAGAPAPSSTTITSDQRPAKRQKRSEDKGDWGTGWDEEEADAAAGDGKEETEEKKISPASQKETTANETVVGVPKGWPYLRNESVRMDSRIERTPFVIGRKGHNVVVDLDLSKFTTMKTISHKHAEIRYDVESKMFYLMSLGRNGTKVNNVMYKSPQQKHLRVDLKDGDTIEIGKLPMKFEFRI